MARTASCRISVVDYLWMLYVCAVVFHDAASNVTDIHSVLELTVYDEDADKKVEFLGKVAIPLLRVWGTPWKSTLHTLKVKFILMRYILEKQGRVDPCFHFNYYLIASQCLWYPESRLQSPVRLKTAGPHHTFRTLTWGKVRWISIEHWTRPPHGI